jgi:hypothetical protein
MNKDNASKGASGGIGFCGMLTIALIVLKLLGLITLPWIWVLIGPFLLCVAISIIVTIIILVIALIIRILSLIF